MLFLHSQTNLSFVCHAQEVFFQKMFLSEILMSNRTTLISKFLLRRLWWVLYESSRNYFLWLGGPRKDLTLAEIQKRQKSGQIISDDLCFPYYVLLILMEICQPPPYHPVNIKIKDDRKLNSLGGVLVNSLDIHTSVHFWGGEGVRRHHTISALA